MVDPAVLGACSEGSVGWAETAETAAALPQQPPVLRLSEETGAVVDWAAQGATAVTAEPPVRQATMSMHTVDWVAMVAQA